MNKYINININININIYIYIYICTEVREAAPAAAGRWWRPAARRRSTWTETNILHIWPTRGPYTYDLHIWPTRIPTQIYYTYDLHGPKQIISKRWRNRWRSTWPMAKHMDRNELYRTETDGKAHGWWRGGAAHGPKRIRPSRFIKGGCSGNRV